MTKPTSLLALILLCAAPAFAAAPAAPAAKKHAAKAAPQSLMPSVPAPQPDPLPGDPLQATIYRLSNGLTVYLSPNHQVPRITSRIAVRTGSYNDPHDTTGLAHYLEHMLFKGTTSLGTLDYAKEKPYLDQITALYDRHFKAKDPAEREKIYQEIDKENIQASKYEVPNEIAKVYRELGFKDLNAHTSDEETVFEVDMPSNRADVWATLESERFAHPVFRLFQSELEAVYEEKNRTMDNAETILDEALNRKLYKVSPYGQQTTIGEIEHLKNPSLTKMYDYFHTWYHPNNMAIALSGDFDRDEMLKLLEKHFGSWKPQPVPMPKVYPLPPPNGTERVEVKHEAEEKVVIAWPTVPLRDKDSDAIMVMDMLVDNSVAGLINLELVQAQKVKEAGSYPSFYNEAGDWRVWAVPKRGQTLEEAERLLLETVDHLKQGHFTDDDIKAVITSFEVGEKARLESNTARADYMADSFIHRETWPQTVGRLDRLRRVTKADVLRVADKYIGPNRVIAYRRNGKQEIPSITKPGFTKLEIDETRESPFAKELLAMPAKPIEPRWLVEGKDYVTAQLPSGKLYAARNPFNDLFSLTFVFDRGSRQERDLCAALGLLDLAGAGTMSADEYKKKLFSLGTSLSYGCGEQDSAVELSGLDENLWESLQLMDERFEHPNVDTDTLKNMVDVAIGAHQDTKRDPGAVSGALAEWARRGKDSAVLHELTDAELQALKLPHLLSLIHSVPQYSRRTGYVGNRPVGELAKLLEENRKYKAAPARAPVKLLAPKQGRVIFTNRDMVQARVGVFLADGQYDPGHAVDYNFYGNYLGGGMSSVIFQEIREARSLAYAAWGGYAPADHKGDDNELYSGLECQADKTPEAAALLRQLSLNLPWSPQRFSETSRAIEERYRTDPIRFRSVPGVLMAWEDQGLPPGDPRPARFARSLKYTLGDLKDFAGRFNGRAATIYVLGDRARVGLPELKRLGNYEERTIDQLFPY